MEGGVRCTRPSPRRGGLEGALPAAQQQEPQRGLHPVRGRRPGACESLLRLSGFARRDEEGRGDGQAGVVHIGRRLAGAEPAGATFHAEMSRCLRNLQAPQAHQRRGTPEGGHALHPVKSSPHHPGRIRLGLCCQFSQAPIKFRTTTATALARLPRRDQLVRLAELCRHNADSLLAALEFCATHSIGAFRIQSQILPVKTHPQAGYRIEELPEAKDIVMRFQRCGAFAKEKNIRTGFHPDQFVVLNSPDRGVVGRAVADLEYQAEVAEWTNADTINIHGGGAYGDKRAALKALRRNLNRLSSRSRSRLTLENDDKSFTPADLLPVCRAEGIPLVYDAHHHRCCPDGLSVEAASAAAALLPVRRAEALPVV